MRTSGQARTKIPTCLVANLTVGKTTKKNMKFDIDFSFTPNKFGNIIFEVATLFQSQS